MKQLISILYIICSFISMNAQINFDYMLMDVAIAEKDVAYRFSQQEIDYLLQNKLNKQLQHHFNFNENCDTIYLIENMNNSGEYLSFMISSMDTIMFQYESEVIDASQYLVPSYQSLRGIIKQLELLKKWDISEILRIGVLCPPNHPHLMYMQKTLSSRIIINNDGYTISSVEYWGSGFDPCGWDEFDEWDETDYKIGRKKRPRK